MELRRREQEVWQACDDLWTSHGDVKYLTGDAIRDHLVSLGKSRGSPNEIYKYRKTWAEHRQIDQAKSEDNVDHDPISRAVKLVHEQLQVEAVDKVERLRKDFKEELENKNEEISRLKLALDKIMEEFSALSEELRKSHEIQVLTAEQLRAEISIRQALEREHVRITTELTEVKSSHDRIVGELKELQINELERLSELYKSETLIRDQKIDSLSKEKTALGHSFSKQLIGLKLECHNLLCVKNDLEKKLAASVEDKTKISGELTICQQKLEAQSAKTRELSHEIAHLKSHVLMLQQYNDAHISENNKLTLLLKKAELSIARLRAIR